MTDYEARRRVPRYDPGVPTTGVAAILVTVIALAAGFMVLRTINNDPDSITSLGVGSSATVGDGATVLIEPSDGGGGTPADPTGSSVVGTTPTTAAIAAVYTGTTIIVANANSVGGSAGDAKDLLETATDFQLGEPTNSSDAVGQLKTSVIYYDSANPVAKQVADTLARVLGGINVSPLPAESPIKGERGDSGVILMLGEDLAKLALTNLVQPYKAGPVSPATVPAPEGTGDSTPDGATENTL